MAKWKSLSSSEKSKYQEMYQADKNELGELYRSDIKKNKMTPEEAKKKKQARDILRQTKIRKAKASKDSKEKMNIEKLKKIINGKTDKICELKKKTEELNSYLMSIEIESQAVEKLIIEKENAGVLMKKKYKLAFSHNSVCHTK